MLGVIPTAVSIYAGKVQVMSIMDGFETSRMLDGAAAEANHRIANNLALIAGLIRFQTTRISPDPLLPAQDVRDWLQQMSMRIDAVGRLHRLLTNGNGHATVDLVAYVNEVADAAKLALSWEEQTEILLDLDPDCTISSQQATAVGLVIGEAITNAIKYSHPGGVPGKIKIMCRRNKGGGMVIEVSDDGVGLPESFDPNTAESTGMTLMRNLSRQLNARLEFERRPIGLCVRLELPPSP
jgi:two-component sensor histidine kinase